MIDRAYASSRGFLTLDAVDQALRSVVNSQRFQLFDVHRHETDKSAWVVEGAGVRVVIVRRKSFRMIEVTPAEGERFDVNVGWVAHVIATELARRWRGRRSFSREPKLTWAPDALRFDSFAAWEKAWKELNP